MATSSYSGVLHGLCSSAVSSKEVSTVEEYSETDIMLNDLRLPLLVKYRGRSFSIAASTIIFCNKIF